MTHSGGRKGGSGDNARHGRGRKQRRGGGARRVEYSPRTRRGEVVYDPFLGSGTAMIAAEITGRICYGVEIEPLYVDVALLRWQTLTGKSARLEGDGRTFAEVQGARAADMRTRRPAEDGAEEAACPDRS